MAIRFYWVEANVIYEARYRTFDRLAAELIGDNVENQPSPQLCQLKTFSLEIPSLFFQRVSSSTFFISKARCQSYK